MLNLRFFNRIVRLMALVSLTGLLSMSFSACVSVKPYQRVYLNDAQMRLGKPDIAAFDESAQSYREGASGGGNGKASGGCACN